MFKINYNPILERWNSRIANISIEKKKLIEKNIDLNENLKVIKRTRRTRRDGDIFICSLNDFVYYYGKVLRANILNPSNNWINGCSLICIFREKTKEKNLGNYKGNCNNLLCVPNIVTSQYWSNGWFETIGNIPLTDEETRLDYGFYRKDFIGKNGSFFKENGEMMDHIPKFFDSYGVTSLNGIYMDIRVETIIDPSLLKMD